MKPRDARFYADAQQLQNNSALELLFKEVEQDVLDLLEAEDDGSEEYRRRLVSAASQWRTVARLKDLVKLYGEYE